MDQQATAIDRQVIQRTVAVVDMAGYSDVLRLLQENSGSNAATNLNHQIQELIESALRHVPADAYTKVIETGDGAILLFQSPADAHLFAEHLHLNAEKHNRNLTQQSAMRKFRVGIATGEVTRETNPQAHAKYAGIAISDATRLEAAAEPGEIIMDAATFASLPHPNRAAYTEESTVPGKRSELFRVRRYKVVGALQASATQPSASKPSDTRHLRHIEVGAAVAAVLAALLGIWFTHFYHPQSKNSDPPILQRVQAKPNSVVEGDRVTVTVELSKPAPAGGVSVHLSSNDPAILTVDGDAYVREGDTTGTAYSKAVDTPTYLSPIQIIGNYNNQARHADVNVVASSATHERLKPTTTPPIRIAINNNASNTQATTTQHQSQVTTPVTSPQTTPAPDKPTALDPELLSRLDDAQGRLAAEKSYWENVKTHLPPNTSLRPEITSQIFAAESASQRCSKDRTALDATALSSCIDALNDHLTQLHIQR